MADQTPVEDLEGEELDEAVQREVVQEEVDSVPPYSSSPVYADEVVKRVREISRDVKRRFYDELGYDAPKPANGERAPAIDVGSPEAICRAALIAVRESPVTP